MLVWLALSVTAVINGLVRETWYAGMMSEPAAHRISTLTAILLTGLLVWALSSRWRFASASQALRTGLLWLVMTVLFEFGFGHYVAGHSWRRLLRDYNISAGRVWIVFLLWLIVMPVLFYRLRSRGGGAVR
jgi:hypothetical protein